jgi:CPSF A subunit region
LGRKWERTSPPPPLLLLLLILSLASYYSPLCPSSLKFFISSISVIKNYIVIADVCNSVQFLVWREEDLTLTLVSKDMDSQTVLSTAFISDGAALGIVVGDDEANIQLMKFDPRYSTQLFPSPTPSTSFSKTTLTLSAIICLTGKLRLRTGLDSTALQTSI